MNLPENMLQILNLSIFLIYKKKIFFFKRISIGLQYSFTLQWPIKLIILTCIRFTHACVKYILHKTIWWILTNPNYTYWLQIFLIDLLCKVYDSEKFVYVGLKPTTYQSLFNKTKIKVVIVFIY